MKSKHALQFVHSNIGVVTVLGVPKATPDVPAVDKQQ